MTDRAPAQRMILCAGLQSGGTTLVSWCFLQRGDTNGVLDMKNDTLYTSFERAVAPVLWIKMTVGPFRWLDVAETYRDLGWNPAPLLIVRDVRSIYGSLITKTYGFNGTSAEEPPLRMRFRRFLYDWGMFRANNWPIIRFEDLILDARKTLTVTCRELGMEWDEAMLTWPKAPEEIAYYGNPNATFARSIKNGAIERAILPARAEICAGALPIREHLWLEKTFAEYNAFHGYPLELSPTEEAVNAPDLPPPRYQGSKRQKIAAEVRQMQWICEMLKEW